MNIKQNKPHYPLLNKAANKIYSLRNIIESAIFVASPISFFIGISALKLFIKSTNFNYADVVNAPATMLIIAIGTIITLSIAIKRLGLNKHIQSSINPFMQFITSICILLLLMSTVIDDCRAGNYTRLIFAWCGTIIFIILGTISIGEIRKYYFYSALPIGILILTLTAITSFIFKGKYELPICFLIMTSIYACGIRCNWFKIWKMLIGFLSILFTIFLLIWALSVRVEMRDYPEMWPEMQEEHNLNNIAQ